MHCKSIVGVVVGVKFQYTRQQNAIDRSESVGYNIREDDNQNGWKECP